MINKIKGEIEDIKFRMDSSNIHTSLKRIKELEKLMKEVEELEEKLKEEMCSRRNNDKSCGICISCKLIDKAFREELKDE